ncbi:EAL domain-containing response regulator [Granulosicoccus sp. 3-233]|uniref:EAL domain-containing response regulator n=1 Tax=Granulosicoccus sp. 3-233 TaxID=3417969 RepID=UPI003D3380C5
MIEPIVLFVDDEPAILRAIVRTFRQSPLQVLTAESPTEALEILRASTVAVLVSDYCMPETSGAELLGIIREISPDTVRMILSGNNDQKATIDAINQGAVSRFLTKPWNDELLISEIGAAVAIWESRVYWDPGKALFKQAPLLQHLDSILSRDRPPRSAMALIAVRNLESMEEHLSAEDLLRMLGALPVVGTIPSTTRLLGLTDDRHFCAFLDLADSDQDMPSAVQSLLSELPVNAVVHEQKHRVEYDVAFAEVEPDDLEGAALLRKAQLAMQNAKTARSDSIVVYDRRMLATHGRKSRLEISLNSALSRQELSLHYQPKIETSTHEMRGAEALLRWHSESLGVVSPTEFIPLAERSGLITEIGEWVINEAVRQWREWFPDTMTSPVISVNVSPRQLNDTNFLQRLMHTLDTHRFQPSNLELEITESMMLDDMHKVIEILTQIRKLGVRLSIDDFGTGYSSLSYLSRLPVDTVKIDRAFILPMLESTEKRTLVRNLIRLGHDLGMQLVAEGVETGEQLTVLREFECDLIQGYYFSPPVSTAEFIEKTSALTTPLTIGERRLSVNSG